MPHHLRRGRSARTPAGRTSLVTERNLPRQSLLRHARRIGGGAVCSLRGPPAPPRPQTLHDLFHTQRGSSQRIKKTPRTQDNLMSMITTFLKRNVRPNVRSIQQGIHQEMSSVWCRYVLACYGSGGQSCRRAIAIVDSRDTQRRGAAGKPACPSPFSSQAGVREPHTCTFAYLRGAS